MKHIEYILLTALTGVITWGLGDMMWLVFSNLGTTFAQIAQALQLRP
jgi:hypothetical protein